MTVIEFLRLLQLLPKNQKEATTVKQIGRKFFRLSERDDLSPNRYQKIYRGLEGLCRAEGCRSPVVGSVMRGKAKHYFLNDSQIIEWFMTEQAALSLLLSKQALNIALGGAKNARLRVQGDASVFSDGPVDQAAEHRVDQAASTARLWSTLRMARNGIGRLPPTINADAIQAVFDAVAQDRQIRRTYVNSAGEKSEADVSIHGLVFKDDSLYVLASDSLSGPLHHMTGHRILSAEVLHKPAQHRPGFNIDKYIEEDYQLSHVLNREKVSEPIELILRVRPDYVYHFKERRMTSEQREAPDGEREGWVRFSAKLPNNYVLKAFLQSMGPGVEVLAPSEVRSMMANDALATAALYSPADLVSKSKIV